MDQIEVTRDGGTNRFSVVLTRGGDSVRCMVTVAAGNGEVHTDQEMRRAALSAAKALGRALDAAISDA